MREVTYYEALDGTKFSNKVECQFYEFELVSARITEGVEVLSTEYGIPERKLFQMLVNKGSLVHDVLCMIDDYNINSNDIEF